jgi:phosphoribosylaminoimidazole-succinocarboxamide synthase
MSLKVETREKLYEGKAKIVYATSRRDLVIQYFKDDATPSTPSSAGRSSARAWSTTRCRPPCSSWLGRQRVPTHYVATLSEREMLCRKLDIIKIETIVRNVGGGKPGQAHGPAGRARPVKTRSSKLYYKSDPLGDPMLNDEHVAMLKLASPRELTWIEADGRDGSTPVLRPHLRRRGLLLVDFKLEFGRHRGKLYLGDEISPDTCRLWDAKTRQKLDKDRFRQDLGGVEEAYHEVYRRVVQGIKPA